MTRQLRLGKARPLAGFQDEPSDAENHAGPSTLLEAAMDDENELEPVPGDEDEDEDEDEDQDAHYDVEEADTIEPDEVNGKPPKVVHPAPSRPSLFEPSCLTLITCFTAS
jgi:hypothetical protein